jgi:diguanylate cyclase (GGDEF)-like protein
MNAEQLLAAMRRTVEQLSTFNDIGKALISTLEVSQVLDLMGARLSALLGARQWSLLLKGDDGLLHFELAQGKGAARLGSEVLRPGEGVAGAVLASGHSRVVRDVKFDGDFASRFDQLTSFTTGSVLAVPLKVRGEVVGVLELVAEAGGRPFSDDDVLAAATVADFAAIAIDNARNFRRVQELTLTDEHTGLANARHLKEELEHEVARCARFARPVSLLFLDLDDFKAVNDTHGHLVGSAALRHAGVVMTSAIRTVDTACRYGGDEFAVILVETGVDGSDVVADRILAAFRAQPFQVEGGPQLTLQCSVGLATFPGDGLTAKALLEAADRAMYRAKRAGKGKRMRLGEGEAAAPTVAT